MIVICYENQDFSYHFIWDTYENSTENLSSYSCSKGSIHVKTTQMLWTYPGSKNGGEEILLQSNKAFTEILLIGYDFLLLQATIMLNTKMEFWKKYFS